MLDIYYAILGLSPESTPEELRKRYLALVKQYTPETHPTRFAQIRHAYENIDNSIELLDDMVLLDSDGASIRELIAEVLEDIRDERVPTQILLNMGR